MTHSREHITERKIIDDNGGFLTVCLEDRCEASWEVWSAKAEKHLEEIKYGTN